jgi:5-(carboxyamino)imidazole ribonucleotide synthase
MQQPATARIGVLGGGQLARMLAIAGAPLGVRVVQLTPDTPAGEGLVDTIGASYTDRAALRELAARSDTLTYETENIPAETVEFLATLRPLLPPIPALVTAGDRWAEKDLFHSLDIPTAPFTRITEQRDLHAAAPVTGMPAVVKTRRLGYDGRGQLVCRSEEELLSAWERLGGVPLLCEAWVPFQREISVVAVRSRNGELQCYAPGENTHENGILRACIAPAPQLSQPVAATAATYVRRIMEALDYVGVLALELFQHGDALLANEMAPRVHNTGHWTIEGAESSQFENHLRAVLGWPLGSTAHHGHAVMVNLIGTHPPLSEMLAIPGARVHLYGKTARPGRKLGHVTVVTRSEAEARSTLAQLRAALEGPESEARP